MAEEEDDEEEDDEENDGAGTATDTHELLERAAGAAGLFPNALACEAVDGVEDAADCNWKVADTGRAIWGVGGVADEGGCHCDALVTALA